MAAWRRTSGKREAPHRPCPPQPLRCLPTTLLPGYLPSEEDHSPGKVQGYQGVLCACGPRSWEP